MNVTIAIFENNIVGFPVGLVLPISGIFTVGIENSWNCIFESRLFVVYNIVQIL